jgi:hypothetical protein
MLACGASLPHMSAVRREVAIPSGLGPHPMQVLQPPQLHPRRSPTSGRRRAGRARIRRRQRTAVETLNKWPPAARLPVTRWDAAATFAGTQSPPTGEPGEPRIIGPRTPPRCRRQLPPRQCSDLPHQSRRAPFNRPSNTPPHQRRVRSDRRSGKDRMSGQPGRPVLHRTCHVRPLIHRHSTRPRYCLSSVEESSYRPG